MPYGSAYAACKHAALGFSNSLRLELAGSGVEVSVVCPGNVATPWADSTMGVSMLELARASLADAARFAEQSGQRLPNRDVLAPRAVADAIVECIQNPIAEVYTHPGSHAQVVEAVADPQAAERAALPLALAMGRSYASLVARSRGEASS
jgi:short-subunit dehydrogenase